MKNTVKWSLYIGTSWTWCIGMFLPMLIAREFGGIGWFIFALPNICGGILMGQLISSPEKSRLFIEENHSACALFSWVTIGFHAFFTSWVIAHFLGLQGTLTTLAIGLFIYINTSRKADFSKKISAIIWATSIASLGLFFLISPYHRPFSASPDPFDIFGLLIVSIFGFLCCPYFDLTFHRAIQEAPRENIKKIFLSGFIFFFLPMIAATYQYGPYLYHSLSSPAARTPTSFLLACHLIIQTSQTAALHFYELKELKKYRNLFPVGLPIVLILLFLNTPPFSLLASQETIYLCFLIFYSLLFPAYLITIPLKESRNRLIFLSPSALSIPVYWYGFIDKNYYAIPFGIFISIAPTLLQSFLKIKSKSFKRTGRIQDGL